MMKHLPNIISALRIIAAVCLLFCNVTEKLSTRAGLQFCGPQFCGLSGETVIDETQYQGAGRPIRVLRLRVMHG